MVIKNIIYFFLIILFTTASISAQEKNRINQKQNELTRIREEISSLESQLKLKTRKERESYYVLENYNRQSFLIRSLINKLKSEEQLRENQISDNENKISNLQTDIKILKSNYSKYVVSVYKHGTEDEWASVLDAESFEQALLRYKYLKRFSESRVKDLNRLKEKKDSLIVVKEQLENEKEEKIQLAAQKQQEENNLETKRNERKGILKVIRNDKTALLSEIDAKKNAEVKIKDLINKLIEEAEIKRKAEEARIAAERVNAAKNKNAFAGKNTETANAEASSKVYDVNLSTAGFTSFAALKGRLNWPVRSGKIVRKFGENRNEKLNTVTLNYGIDIKTTADENVIAIADGVVSAIDWLPGYGSVIIITHKGDYRTVYSHLSNIYVKEGDKVKLGTVIGQVGESLEGNILHFEIWNSRNKQNPESWLARR